MIGCAIPIGVGRDLCFWAWPAREHATSFCGTGKYGVVSGVWYGCAGAVLEYSPLEHSKGKKYRYRARVLGPPKMGVCFVRALRYA